MTGTIPLSIYHRIAIYLQEFMSADPNSTAITTLSAAHVSPARAIVLNARVLAAVTALTDVLSICRSNDRFSQALCSLRIVLEMRSEVDSTTIS